MLFIYFFFNKILKSWVDFSSNKYADPMFKFNDQRLKDKCDQGDETTVEFFRNLALCHTVMVEEKQTVNSNNRLSANATLQDEVG